MSDYTSVADQREHEPCLECGLSQHDRGLRAEALVTLRADNARLQTSLREVVAASVASGERISGYIAELALLRAELEQAQADLDASMNKALLDAMESRTVKTQLQQVVTALRDLLSSIDASYAGTSWDDCRVRRRALAVLAALEGQPT